jgi:hypothetical protein
VSILFVLLFSGVVLFERGFFHLRPNRISLAELIGSVKLSRYAKISVSWPGRGGSLVAVSENRAEKVRRTMGQAGKTLDKPDRLM